MNAGPGSLRITGARWFPVILLVIGAALVTFFGWRAYRQYERARRIETASFGVESLRGWMTVPYMARLYGIPEDELYGALGVPPEGSARLSLRQLSDKYELDPEAARRTVEQVIQKHSAAPAGGGAPP
jgi:hypothetical protein